jgi:hypothetical protein
LQHPQWDSDARNAVGWLSTGRGDGEFLTCVVSRSGDRHGGDDVTRRRTVRLAACLAVGAVLLSGCSEKQGANETLPSTSAAETTPELPPLGPDDMPMPDEARTQDAAGAEAFVRYYIELINRTSDVMDAKPLRDLSDGCAECNRVANDTEEDAAAGHHYEGGQLTITWIQALEPDPDAEVAFFADQAALRVVDQASQSVEDLSFDAIPQISSGASLRWESRRQTWVMTGLTLG